MKSSWFMIHGSLKKIFLLTTYYLLLTTLVGCTTIIEGAKGFAGISTKALKEGRKNAIVNKFNYDYNTCYSKTQEALKEIGACTYAKDKEMIAIYVSSEDTTAVGLFFKEIDRDNTQIEISSPSTYAKEFIAKKVFFRLEKQKTGVDKETPKE